MSFENERLALEALNIKIWVDGENLKIEGFLPSNSGSIVTTQSPLHLSPDHPPGLLAQQ